ncbi:hypothetical protein V8C37DRAFT_140281 [Trichoderma ceciliae]
MGRWYPRLSVLSILVRTRLPSSVDLALVSTNQLTTSFPADMPGVTETTEPDLLARDGEAVCSSRNENSGQRTRDNTKGKFTTANQAVQPLA